MLMEMMVQRLWLDFIWGWSDFKWMQRLAMVVTTWLAGDDDGWQRGWFSDMVWMAAGVFSNSYHEDESPVKEVEEIQVPTSKKKTNRRRQPPPAKKTSRKAEEPRCVPWTTKEEIALFRTWKTVRPKVATFCGVYDNIFRIYANGANDGD
ncbi:hypothetical protein Tco_0458829 [Tanacetum coccineum]